MQSFISTSILRSQVCMSGSTFVLKGTLKMTIQTEDLSCCMSKAASEISQFESLVEYSEFLCEVS